MELQVIQNKIYEMRGVRVMLDRDLAELYQVTTGNLNKAVKRNIERFPDRFMFQLTKEEFLRFENGVLNDRDPNLVFQNGRSSWGGVRTLPYAFTEQGVSMLSAVLRSSVAVQVSINIMDAFVAMRQYLTSTVALSAELSELRARLELLERGGEETLVAVNDLSEDVYKEIGVIYEAITALSIKPAAAPRRPMGYRFEPNEQ